jgi:hypothetical protein
MSIMVRYRSILVDIARHQHPHTTAQTALGERSRPFPGASQAFRHRIPKRSRFAHRYFPILQMRYRSPVCGCDAPRISLQAPRGSIHLCLRCAFYKLCLHRPRCKHVQAQMEPGRLGHPKHRAHKWEQYLRPEDTRRQYQNDMAASRVWERTEHRQETCYSHPADSPQTPTGRWGWGHERSREAQKSRTQRVVFVVIPGIAM